MNAAPVQAQAFHEFKVKLDLNPLPFADVAQNAYWHGPSKYLAGFGQRPQDTWTTTLTLPKVASNGQPNKSVAGGIISLKEIYFEAKHRKSGDIHGWPPGSSAPDKSFHGTINMKTNVIHFEQNDGGPVRIDGVVRSWWTVKGTRIGPNVIHCALSLVGP